jgi:hypothetical protein
MKRILSVVLFALVVCAGCASNYSIILTNGDVLSSHGKPTYNPQDGYYYYKSIYGETNRVFGAKVREVGPASMADKGGAQFLK